MRCAASLVLSSLLVACAPGSTGEPMPEPVRPLPEEPTEKEDKGWKAITG